MEAIKLKNVQEFFMPMAKIPTGTAQQKRIAVDYRRKRVHVSSSESYANAKVILKRSLIPYRPKTLLKGPIFLYVEYRYSTKTKKQWNTFKVTRPDGDNLLKVIKDQLSGWWFNDDSEVSVETMVRKWVPSGEGGIFIKIAEIEGENNGN